MEGNQRPTSGGGKGRSAWSPTVDGGTSIAIGIAIGVAIGTAMGNIALGIAIGAAMGCALAGCFGVASRRTRDRDAGSSNHRG